MNNKKNLSSLTYVLDVLMIGVGLCIYAYFHHVRPRVIVPEVPYKTTAPNTHAPENTPLPTSNPLDGADTSGWYYEGFTNGDIVKTDTTYASKNVYISLTEHYANGSTYFVQDIHIRSLDCISTAFAQGHYGANLVEHVIDIANNNNAIGAISGDYYGVRDYGTVLRNGVLYRNEKASSMCVLYNDGTMKTFLRDPENPFNIENEMELGAVQAWYFGPPLLDDNAQMITDFSAFKIGGPNPRSIIGYYEPGHYCFITVDGRVEGYSVGMTLLELSQLVYDLGCTRAYNLDGGGTAQMVFNSELINNPKGDKEREISDIIYIREPGE